MFASLPEFMVVDGPPIPGTSVRQACRCYRRTPGSGPARIGPGGDHRERDDRPNFHLVTSRVPTPAERPLPLGPGSLRALALTLTVWAVTGAGGAEGQEPRCRDGRISEITIDNQSIFATGEMDDDTSFQWAYRLANRLHIETRESFIREELLFREGDCYDPLLLAESERILRNYEFVAQAETAAEPLPDGSYRVRVETRDEWTTKASVEVAFENGLRFEGAELTEENLAGQGILTSLYYRERREQRDLGLVFQTPRIAGTRTNGSLSFGRTRVGTFFSQGLSYPFVGEVGRASAQESYSRRENLFPYSMGIDAGSSSVLLPYDQEAIEATAALRLGEPGNLTVFGIGLLRESMSFPGFPADAEVAVDGDYSNIRPATEVEAAALDFQVRPLSIFRLNFLAGQRNIRFVQRRGLDALDGVQDVRLGTEVSLTVGRALGDVGSGSRIAPDDLYTRAYLFGSWAPARWILTVNANVEGRVVFPEETPGTNRTTMRDLLGELDLYSYWQWGEATGTGRRTLFGRISGAGGWSVRRPFQLSLGGREGVRGYRERAFPGARRVIVTVEDRRFHAWPAPGLFDFGTTLLADVGRMWAGDVPFGRTSAWQASVGAGLRLGFPTESRGVLRADVHLPVTGPEAWSSPVLRVSLQEVVGLIRGFGDEEVLRSRRPAVGTDLLTGEVR